MTEAIETTDPTSDADRAPAAFSALQQALDTARTEVSASIKAGHMDLAAGVWLSCDPEGQAEMSVVPEEEGMRLSVRAAESGRWASFGMQVPTDILAGGRYVGLLLEIDPASFVSLSPSLRFRFEDGGMHDVWPPLPIVMPDGLQTHLLHLPVDRDMVTRAVTAELNLFVNSNRADLLIRRLEVLLIV